MLMSIYLEVLDVMYVLPPLEVPPAGGPRAAREGEDRHRQAAAAAAQHQGRRRELGGNAQ